MLAVLLLTLAVGTSWGSGAWADHLAVLQLDSDSAGPYAVSAWTSPDPITVGAGTVTVAVTPPPNGGGLTDLRVSVTASPVEGGGAPVSVAASRVTGLFGIRYLADLSLRSAGRWVVTIAVDGPHGAGRANFPLAVEPVARPRWALLALSAAVVGLLVAWRLRREGRRARPAGPR